MTRLEVAIWARRICTARTAEPHVMLNIAADASLELAQQAFHAIARVAHPDVHRTTASPEELEVITTAFALVAASYQTFRSQRTSTKMATVKVPQRSNPPSAGPPTKLAPQAAVILPEKGGAPISAPQMSQRAMIHYRKAEQALRRGEIPAAVLHMKMAIAADPQSAFLRQAMKEVEGELGKKA